MPKYHVSKSIEIDASVEKVYPLIKNFRSWPKWSPWLIAEPDCTLNYATDGSNYAWDGTIVGSGAMEILEAVANQSIAYRLSFLKPFKSENETSFKLDARDGKTTLTWNMVGSLPMIMFFMKKIMSAWIGMDFMRGLTMIKDLAETGSVPSHLDCPGTKLYLGHDFVGIKTRCSIQEIGPKMEADFKALGDYCNSLELDAHAKPFAIYHKWDLVRETCEYTTGVPVKTFPPDLKEGYISGSIPEMDIYPVEMTGPYRHLSNAWSVGMMHARAKVFDQNKKHPPFEVYANNPSEVEEDELMTVVCFPVK